MMRLQGTYHVRLLQRDCLGDESLCGSWFFQPDGQRLNGWCRYVRCPVPEHRPVQVLDGGKVSPDGHPGSGDIKLLFNRPC